MSERKLSEGVAGRARGMRLASGCEDCGAPRWPGGVCNDCANRLRAALADAVLAIVERALAEAEDKEE